MKKKELKKLRQESGASLRKLLEDKRIEKIKTFMELKTGQLKNPKKVMRIKKEVAQILTLIREIELRGEK